MKRFLPVLIICSLVLILAACSGKPDNTGTTVEPAATAAGSTAKPETTTVISTSAPETTKAATTVTAEFTTIYNPEVVTGKPEDGAGTYTGYAPLPAVSFNVSDPDNNRGLSAAATGYSFGVGKDGNPPAQSLRNQAAFDQYNALAIDTKSAGKVLYLTFDCGWENGYTGNILDTLKAKNVPAAFFCTLKGYIDREPALIVRMIKEGHIVGNHSNTHPKFPNLSKTEMAKEIQDCDNYLRAHFGYSAPYFRFPSGEYSDCALDLVRSIGFKSVFWSAAYADWDVNNQKGRQYAFDTVTSRLHPGAVILLHTVSPDNAAALGDIIDWARGQGYQFISL